MASIDWSVALTPRVEIIKMQRSKIRECENAILKEISDAGQSCAHVNSLLCQLKLLFKMHFMYEEQLLEEVDVAAAEEQKHIHDSFLMSFDHLNSDNDQCHTLSYMYDIQQLRLTHSMIMNNETIMLCDFIKNISA